MSATTAPAAPSHPKPSKVLACVHCQYRKIKCDRQQPCSNCVKAKISCKPSVPAPPHKRRRPNQDLLERLARCEQLLKQYTDGNVPPGQRETAPATASPGVLISTTAGMAAEPGPSRSSSSSQIAPLSAIKVENNAQPAYKPTGKVIEEDGNVRFMDNSVRLSFYDELTAMRSLIDDEDQESEPSTVGLSPDNNADIFLGVEDAAIDLQELQPDLVNVFRLWQLFIDRINPLIKVVHIPSLQPYVMDAAADITKVPLAYQALLFSIYTTAVISLTSQEAVQLLGTTREEALNRFTRGTKLALTRSNFMKNYNMTILQALLLYMVSLTGPVENHSIWIMSGTVMRIAQKMGYHRDGEQFNLSPFETEMRRRIWWHVVTQDSRYAMLSGLSHAWVAQNWDTKMPQNLNDEDLSPNSMKPLVPRSGPSEMVFVLMTYHYQRFTDRSHRDFEDAFLALRNGNKGDVQQQQQQVPGPIEKYRALVDQLDIELATFEREYVDPAAGPIQEAAAMVRPLFIQKMRNIMVPLSERPEYGTEIFDQLDGLLNSFVTSHLKSAAAYKRLAELGFTWFVRAGFHLDAMPLFTAKLYKRPMGNLTERAWIVFGSLHDLRPDLFDISQKKIERQAQFTLKAWAAREQALAQVGKQVEVPEFVQRLRSLMSSSRTGSLYTTSSGSPTTGSQQFLVQQTSPYQPMSLDPRDMSQYLGTNMNTPNFSLDMWGNLMMDNDDNSAEDALPFGAFDFSKLDFSSMEFTG